MTAINRAVWRATPKHLKFAPLQKRKTITEKLVDFSWEHGDGLAGAFVAGLMISIIVLGAL
jgi:hypothetical protein